MSQRAGLRGARFAPPRSHPIALERTHLLDRIDAGVAQVTLVCAPAGFGKTTLLQQSRRRFAARGMAAIWLQVEPADNDLGRFLLSLTSAIQTALGEPDFAPVVERHHAADASPVQGRASGLLERLSLSEAPLALFLDDLELMVDEAVWAFLERLVADLDMHHRIILAGRTRPPLALGRLRAHGHLLELDQADLRFTPEEIRTFLERQSIGASSIKALQQHAEGWPAVLQLAAAALAARKVPDAFQSISATSAGIAEYIAQEVLDSQPAHRRDFLLHSAVLGEFCSELCDAVLDRCDSAEMIAQIVQHNLLIVPIDAEQRWYRYHPLLADFLVARVALGGREKLKLLHGRAADWARTHGFTGEAITHALAAGNRTLAADLLAASAMDNLHSGRVADTAQAIALLPDDEIRARPALLRAAAFAAIFAHRYEAARRYMELIAQREANAAEEDDEMVAMRLMLLGWTDAIPDLLRAVEALQSRAVQFGRFTAGLAANARAFCHIALGHTLEAERDLAKAREACEPIDALYVLSYSTCFAAAMDLNFGQVATARATLESAFARAIDGGQRYGSSGAVVATYLAECLYEANELDACQTLVDDYLPIVRETGLPDHLIVLHRIAARLHFMRGRSDAGHAVLIELGEIGARRGLRRLAAAAWIERSYAHLRNHDIAGARRALAFGREGALWESFGAFKPHAGEIDDATIGELRLQLTTGGASAALAAIQAGRHAAETTGRRRRALRLLFLEAQALEGAQRRREAGAAFDQAIMRAVEGGMARVLADEAWASEALVVRSAVRREPRAVDLLRELRGPIVASSTTPRGEVPSEVTGGAARLTTREVQILRLVWKGSSNKAIAQALFLTENTIETHLRRIYQKLGTRKRTQAAALAHEAGAI